MLHRMDPPPAGWTPMPSGLAPMRATPADRLPADDDAWAYELDWPGRRVLAAISGGRVELRGTPDKYREVNELAEWLAPTECLLDGLLVTVDGTQFFAVDLLWLDGYPTVSLPYVDRRELLTGLALTGPHWQTPPHFPGGGRYALDAARDQGVGGVIAKRLDSPYVAGEAPGTWLRVRA
jgi:bifunctional non-homologous end joining protein LigD